jgi:hypothetical protein
MIYLYSRKNHLGLDLLTSALGATRLSRFDGESFWTKDRKQRLELQAGSVVIPWGENLPELEDLRVLNGTEKDHNKITRHETLASNGVKTVRAYDPEMNPANYWRENANFIARKFGEKYSLNSISFPDYYSEKVNFTNEYVIHSFGARSIRAGELKPRLTATDNLVTWLSTPSQYAHPWIRNEAHGWTTDTTFKSTPELRALAHKAVKVLGLTFGMVKIGKLTTGNLMVISVNKAPDLRGLNAVKNYVKAINKWVETGQTQASTPSVPAGGF